MNHFFRQLEQLARALTQPQPKLTELQRVKHGAAQRVPVVVTTRRTKRK